MATGDSIDAMAMQQVDAVPQDALQKRRERDGQGFHVTLASKAELATLSPSQVSELELAASQLSESAISIGLGSAASGSDKCWYVVLLWPDAQQVRQAAGLPRCHLHITVGFNKCDVHGCAKGVRTVMADASYHTARLRQWEAVANVARTAARGARPVANAEHDRDGTSNDDLPALERLELEASLAATPAIRADLVCSRCELQARLGMHPSCWAADVVAAVELDRRAPRPWLTLARAYCAQRRFSEARTAVLTAIQRSERVGDPVHGQAAQRLLGKLPGVPAC